MAYMRWKQLEIEQGRDLDTKIELARDAIARAWIAYARGSPSPSLKNPQGLVVARLRAGVPPPANGRGQERRGYVPEEYAEYIQH